MGLTIDIIASVLTGILYTVASIGATLVLLVGLGAGYLLIHDRHREQVRLWSQAQFNAYLSRRQNRDQ